MSLKLEDIENLLVGKSKLRDVKGKIFGYVGQTDLGEIVLQDGNIIKAHSELSFEIQKYKLVVPETTYKLYMDQCEYEDFIKEQKDDGTVTPFMITEQNEHTKYEVTMTIKEIMEDMQ